ncbi:hypothetical protein ACJMK2_030945 [Sinanodonta woodiana]|uniref:STAS domain-containing protein n=1 Tax=Sinanodonta woodiana TaxID=1069815 RepID=A0ABD3WYN4_SINWO
MPCSAIDIVINRETIVDVKGDDGQTKGLDNPAFQSSQSLSDIQLRQGTSSVADDKSLASSSAAEHTTELDFRNVYLRQREKKTLKQSCKAKCIKCCTCSSEKWKSTIDKILPCVKTVRKYNIKEDLLSDVVCGLTVGVTQIPLAMACAMLANLSPFVGLYTNFFPVLIYFLFGSSRHIAMGTAAIISLLTGSVITKLEDLESSNIGTEALNATANITVSPVVAAKLSDSTKIGIAMGLALLVGIVQLGMGVLRLGFVTTYISDPLVGGFTTGIGLLVITSQVKHLLGVTLPITEGMYQLIRTWIAIIEAILKTNIATVIISIISMAILYIVKEHINQRFKHKLKVPIPIEIVVVIIGTTVSYVWDYKTRFNVKIVGDLPTGLPKPMVPTIGRPDLYMSEIFIIAILGFAQSVSLAALMAKKHNYTTDSNQELVAYGLGNIFGSFFSCYPYAASVSGSFIQDSSGGKTEVASLFSAALIAVVIVWIGDLFRCLPNAILAAIIVVALKNLLLQFGDLPRIWRISRFDFFIWIVTCACTALLNVDYGLLIGVVFSFFTVVIRTQTAIVSSLGKIDDPNLYRNAKKYVTEQTEGIKIVDFNCPLYFANADIFVRKLQRITGVKPEKVSKQLRRGARMNAVEGKSTSSTENNKEDINEETSEDNAPYTVMNGHVKKSKPTRADICPVHHIIIDFSAVSFIDSVGAKIIKQVFEDYSKIDVTVFLACVAEDVWILLDTVELLKKYSGNIFPTVDVAVARAKKQVDNGVVDDAITYF